MGAIGSGRQSYSLRRTTEDYLSIDVRVWHREGLLIPGVSSGWQWSRYGQSIASLQMSASKERLNLRPLEINDSTMTLDTCSIRLDWTPCGLGGKRTWFRCPCCRARVAILYWAPAFGCRRCFDLAYPSERENEFDRSARRAGWVRKKLGWKPGILNGPGTRPKGMHRTNYHRLVIEHEKHIGYSFERIHLLNRALHEKLLLKENKGAVT